jgi:hypothetical protein
MNAKIRALSDTVVAFLKSAGEKIRTTHPFLQIASFLACASIVFLLLLSVIVSPRMQRSVFFFPEDGSASDILEVRYIPRAKTREARLERYVSELLLGPITPGVQALFAKNTELVDCLVRGDTAYINLSPDALELAPGLPGYRRAADLFEKNVCTNFRSVGRIYLYFDGIEVYSDQPYVDADAKK